MGAYLFHSSRFRLACITCLGIRLDYLRSIFYDLSECDDGRADLEAYFSRIDTRIARRKSGHGDV